MTMVAEPRTAPWQSRPAWGISVDLTPREVLRGRRDRVNRRLILLGLVVVLLLCGGLALMSSSDRDSAQKSYDDAQSSTARLRAQSAQYADVSAANSVLAQTQSQAATLMVNDIDVVNLMARIRNVTPAGVVIGTLAVVPTPADPTAEKTTGGRALIGSVAISGSGGQISDLAPFVASLNRLRGVVDVVPTSTTSSAAGMTFSLSLNFTDVLYTHRFDQGASQ